MIHEKSSSLHPPTTKFRIPVGILQNSEFCRKLLPIRPEPRSDVLFFLIFTRPERMNLDLRSDTRICRSKSELLHNHTNDTRYQVSKYGMVQVWYHMCECTRRIFSATTPT